MRARRSLTERSAVSPAPRRRCPGPGCGVWTTVPPGRSTPDEGTPTLRVAGVRFAGVHADPPGAAVCSVGVGHGWLPGLASAATLRSHQLLAALKLGGLSAVSGVVCCLVWTACSDVPTRPTTLSFPSRLRRSAGFSGARTGHDAIPSVARAKRLRAIGYHHLRTLSPCHVLGVAFLSDARRPG